MRHIYLHQWKSPAGELIVGDFDGRICLCDWLSGPRQPANLQRLERELCAKAIHQHTPLTICAIDELAKYFNGQLRQFTCPVMISGTDFQRRVRTLLTEIAYGERISYGEVARRVGSPTGVRSVAAAIASNPLSIFVPCHRVVGADGSLTGYACGIEAKRILLHIESGVQCPLF